MLEWLSITERRKSSPRITGAAKVCETRLMASVVHADEDDLVGVRRVDEASHLSRGPLVGLVARPPHEGDGIRGARSRCPPG